MGRTAIVKLLWAHRHDMSRWGRSLWSEVRNPDGVSPARLATIGRVLVAITSDEKVSSAGELRQVRLVDDTIVLDVAPGWERARSVSDRLLQIKGVRQVMIETGGISRR